VHHPSSASWAENTIIIESTRESGHLQAICILYSVGESTRQKSSQSLIYFVYFKGKRYRIFFVMLRSCQALHSKYERLSSLVSVPGDIRFRAKNQYLVVESPSRELHSRNGMVEVGVGRESHLRFRNYDVSSILVSLFDNHMGSRDYSAVLARKRTNTNLRQKISKKNVLLLKYFNFTRNNLYLVALSMVERYFEKNKDI
jgi:hypothetical protein